jgi:hypothetical protein
VRFKQFILSESINNIVKMFGDDTPMAGSPAFGAQAAAKSGIATTEDVPELKQWMGAPNAAQKAKKAMGHLADGFRRMGVDPAAMTGSLDQNSIIQAMSIGMSTANTLDKQALSIFAQKVNPKDVEDAMKAQRQQQIQAPMIQANQIAAQVGAQMAQSSMGSA